MGFRSHPSRHTRRGSPRGRAVTAIADLACVCRRRKLSWGSAGAGLQRPQAASCRPDRFNAAAEFAPDGQAICENWGSLHLDGARILAAVSPGRSPAVVIRAPPSCVRVMNRPRPPGGPTLNRHASAHGRSQSRCTRIERLPVGTAPRSSSSRRGSRHSLPARVFRTTPSGAPRAEPRPSELVPSERRVSFTRPCAVPVGGRPSCRSHRGTIARSIAARASTRYEPARSTRTRLPSDRA